MILFIISLSYNTFSTVQQFPSLHPSQCRHPPPPQILQVDLGQGGLRGRQRKEIDRHTNLNLGSFYYSSFRNE